MDRWQMVGLFTSADDRQIFKCIGFGRWETVYCMSIELRQSLSYGSTRLSSAAIINRWRKQGYLSFAIEHCVFLLQTLKNFICHLPHSLLEYPIWGVPCVNNFLSRLGTPRVFATCPVPVAQLFWSSYVIAVAPSVEHERREIQIRSASTSNSWQP